MREYIPILQKIMVPLGIVLIIWGIMEKRWLSVLSATLITAVHIMNISRDAKE
jgi:predicted cobalt transporter CbtA